MEQTNGTRLQNFAMEWLKADDKKAGLNIFAFEKNNTITLIGVTAHGDPDVLTSGLVQAMLQAPHLARVFEAATYRYQQLMLSLTSEELPYSMNPGFEKGCERN